MLGREGLTEASDAALAPDVLAAANINPTTRLATDYLNHFNNVVMLLEFIATMPDFVEEVLQWQPVDYPGYFATSHFRHRELAISAYASADARTRQTFDNVIASLDAAVIEAQSLLRTADPADPAISTAIRNLVRGRMQPLISEAGGVINGSAIVEKAPETVNGNAQDSIDVLFH